MLDTSRSNRCVTAGPYRAENAPQRRRSELAGSDEQEVREASPTRLSWILPNCLDRLARFADPFDHEPGLFERFRVRLKRERPSSESDTKAGSLERLVEDLGVQIAPLNHEPSVRFSALEPSRVGHGVRDADAQ